MIIEEELRKIKKEEANKLILRRNQANN